MIKISSILIFVSLVLSLVSCGGGEKNDKSSIPDSFVSSTYESKGDIQSSEDESGDVDTSGGDGDVDTSGDGGDINTSSGDGGDVNTSSDSGDVNTSNSDSEKILKLSDCKTSKAWVNYTDNENASVFTDAINYDIIKQISEDVTYSGHFAVHKFESVSDIESFKEKNKNELSFDSSWGVASFNEVTVAMNKKYFEENIVFAIYVTDGSSSLNYFVESIEDGTFYLDIEDHNGGETDDMAGWILFVSAPRHLADKFTPIDAVMKYRNIFKLSDCKTSKAWVNYTDNENASVFTDAINYDIIKQISEDVTYSGHFAVHKFESVSDIESFKEKNKNELSFDGSWGGVSSFNEVTSAMNEKYFEENIVFAIYVTDGSSSFNYFVESIEDGMIYLDIEEHNGEATDDMAGWILFVSAPRHLADGYRPVDAIMKDRMS